jgi:hypothetical protein
MAKLIRLNIHECVLTRYLTRPGDTMGDYKKYVFVTADKTYDRTLPVGIEPGISRIGGMSRHQTNPTVAACLVTTKYFFQLNTCGYSPYVTSSLTRGWICRLKLLLALASIIILSSESRGTHDHILLSQIRDSPPTWRATSPYLYPPGTGWPSYTHRHWVLFSSLSTTCRATVEIFEPYSNRGEPHRKHTLEQILYCCLRICFAVEACLQSCSLAMVVYTDFPFSAFSRHAAVYLLPRLLYLLGPAVRLEPWALMYSENLLRLRKWTSVHHMDSRTRKKSQTRIHAPIGVTQRT